ncbi:MAG: 4-diphosphocytidyl-2C-methyl-D-erythritol kinase, partial [Thermoproteota archaeon]
MVLAAGESKRFEAGNKLLFRVGGKSLIRRVVETALASLASEVIVVTGYQAELVEAEISDLRDERLRVVRNPEYREGMSSSVRVGVASA